MSTEKNPSGDLTVQATSQAGHELAFRHRLVEQEPLPDLTADRLQLVAFVRRFDAFSNGAQTEVAAEFDNRFAQAGVELVAVAVRHIGAIDLQFAEGQLREAGKRRVAGAEIVNRKIAFELSQRVGKFFRKLQIMNDLVLGDFERQASQFSALGRASRSICGIGRSTSAETGTLTDNFIGTPHSAKSSQSPRAVRITRSVNACIE